MNYETDGVGHLATTAMNDSGALMALHSLTLQGRADWNRVLLLRTASNYDMQWDGATAAQSLAAEKHGEYTGYFPALGAGYEVGHRVVAEC
jgi:purine nucleoside permease